MSLQPEAEPDWLMISALESAASQGEHDLLEITGKSTKSYFPVH